jgi:hypothetical protein
VVSQLDYLDRIIAVTGNAALRREQKRLRTTCRHTLNNVPGGFERKRCEPIAKKFIAGLRKTNGAAVRPATSIRLTEID